MTENENNNLDLKSLSDTFEEKEGSFLEIISQDHNEKWVKAAEQSWDFSMKVRNTLGLSTENIHAADVDYLTGCSGTNLSHFHKGYFGNPLMAEVFLKTIESKTFLDSLPENPVILGIGSGPGLPEIMIYRKLQSLGKNPKLILSDRIEENLIPYPGYETDDSVLKKVFDNKNIEIPNNSIDIVIARCTVHYESSRDDRLKVLREVKRVLKPGGFFLNQEHAFPTEEEAQLANFERGLGGKHSHHTLGKNVVRMHEIVFGEQSVQLAKNGQPTPLYSDEKDFIERFKIPEEKREEIVQAIRKKILQFQNRLTTNVILLDEPDNRYRRDTPFQLILVQKKKTNKEGNTEK